jgi:endonuclease/exonuclease/phosphatase family metal-dependent hydrolase
MRRVGAALVFVVMVLAGPSEPGATSSGSTRQQTFRVATFNIHKGADRRGHYDLQRTIDVIQRLNVDLIGVQEAMRHHPGFNCDDQPARIAEGLRRRTGRPWTHVSAKAWMTTDRRCVTDGRGSDVASEDLAFISASPIVTSSVVRLSEGRVGLAVRVAAMPQVPVVVTHLAANRENRHHRIQELSVLLPWAERHGPGLLIGDLNAQRDSQELRPVLARYHDAWALAATRGRIAGVLSGSTRPGRRVSRIDHVLYDPRLHLALEFVEIVDVSSDSEWGEVSDHHPVVATFRRRNTNKS